MATRTTFEIRFYGRTELAQLYSPNVTLATAWRRLKECIVNHPTLLADLRTTGYHSQRIFTPAQVQLIIEAIGEP